VVAGVPGEGSGAPASGRRLGHEERPARRVSAAMATMAVNVASRAPSTTAMTPSPPRENTRFQMGVRR